MYRAVVVPALLYSAETYNVYKALILRFNAVQQRHLKRDMGRKLSDLVSNFEALRRDNLESVEASLAEAQLRWLDRVTRMSDSILPKIILYGELAEGNRRQGNQKLRYKDVAKRHLKAMDLDVKSWEDRAPGRGGWSSSLNCGKTP